MCPKQADWVSVCTDFSFGEMPTDKCSFQVKIALFVVVIVNALTFAVACVVARYQGLYIDVARTPAAKQILTRAYRYLVGVAVSHAHAYFKFPFS